MQEGFHRAPTQPRPRAGARLEKILPLIIYLAAAAEAEWTIFYSNPATGAIIYAIIFAAMLLHHYLEKNSVLQQRLLLSLSLAPLMRIAAILIPPLSFYQLYHFALASIPILLATMVVMRLLKLEVEEVGFTLHRLPAQIGIALVGIPLGLAGYFLLEPQTLIIGLTWADMILPGVIFILCTGFIPELIFRGVMQQTAWQFMGKWGLLYVSLLSGIMSMNQFSMLNMLFMFGVALLFSWIVKKTGSLLGVMLAHGIMNIGLYMVIPSIM